MFDARTVLWFKDTTETCTGMEVLRVADCGVELNIDKVLYKSPE